MGMYQACLLKLPTTQVDSKQQVQAVHCIMSSLYDVYQSYDSTIKFKTIVQYEMPDSATTKCLKKFGIQNEVSKEVEACVNSVHGQSALYEIGVETEALQPALSSLPTITLNGIYEQDWEDAALTNFNELLCKRWLSSVPECNTQSGAHA